MISQRQIIRMLRSRQYRMVIERILANGRSSCEQIHDLLTHPSICASVANGLAVQRLMELSYGPSSDVPKVIHRLLQHQGESGMFAPQAAPPEHRIAATAIALRGLMAYMETKPFGRETARTGIKASRHQGIKAAQWEHPSSIGRTKSQRPVYAFRSRIETAINRAFDVLKDVSETHSISDAPIGWAVALWQLAEYEQFRKCVPITNLNSWLDTYGESLLDHELCQYAHSATA